MNVFLSIRVLHILLAATWFGGAFVMIFFIVPAIKEARGAGGAVMAGVQRRKYHAFMQAIAGLTILSGFYLYWRFTGGFDPTLSGSLAGRVFGAGGVAGLLALIVGASVVGRTMAKVGEIVTRAQALPDGAEKAALMQSVGPLQNRAELFGKIVILLMVIAIVCMSVGHYV